MTTRDALTWINGGWKSDQYFNGTGIDVDGMYGMQCFDFVAAYSIFLGNGMLHGAGAVDLWDTAPDSFSREQDPLPGDIFVYGAPYGNDGEIYLGHTGVVTGGTRDRFTSVDQNWNHASLTAGSPPSAVTHNAIGLVGFLRSNKIGEDMPTPELVDVEFQAVFNKQASPEDVAYWTPRTWDEFANWCLKNSIDQRTKASNFDAVNASLKDTQVKLDQTVKALGIVQNENTALKAQTGATDLTIKQAIRVLAQVIKDALTGN